MSPRYAPDGVAHGYTSGERYLSTPLFADIEADMNEAELEIAKSTPSFQLIPGADPVLQA
mgnify:CR=1 FL=1